ncbi:trigger factor-like [Alosa alosa]|uniref:trigger factor-like n=1 Tax=Alosa alosa TaxID=278164 RepID=UPI002015173C|nr:trigger factor-like [Alosa alosa]
MMKVLCYMRRVTGCPPLVQCLHQVLSRNEAATRIQKIVAVEGLYRLFRELLPSRSRMSGDLAVEDHEVFEHSHICWAHLLAEAESEPPENRKSTAVQSEAPENSKSTAVQNEAPGDGDSILVQSDAPENRKSTAVQSEAPENSKSTAVQNEAPGDGDSISVQGEAPENRKSTAVQGEAPENRKSSTVQSDDSDDWDSISGQSEDSDDGDCTSEQSEVSDDKESTSDQSEDSDDGESTCVRLYCEQTRLRFFEPVRIAYLLQVFEKSPLLQKLKDGESIPGCPRGLLREVCVRRATDVCVYQMESPSLAVPLAC